MNISQMGNISHLGNGRKNFPNGKYFPNEKISQMGNVWQTCSEYLVKMSDSDLDLEPDSDSY